MTTPPQPPVSPGPAEPYTLQNLMPAPSGTVPAPLPAHLSPQAAYPPPSPPKKPHWWRDLGSGGQAVILIIAIVVPMATISVILGVLLGEKPAGAKDLSVSPPSCDYTETAFGAVASASFTITNNGKNAARNVRVSIEYRDSGGARVDTDTARVTEIPAGDTVRVEESTNLDATANGGSCKLVGVAAN